MWRALLLLLSTFGQPAPPAPHEPIPASPARVATRLAEVDRQMRAGIDGDITLQALYEQRVYRRLASRPRLGLAVIRRLPASMRPEARDTVSGLHALFTLTSYATERRFRTGPPTPQADLRRYYGQAQRHFGVRWDVLAAINFIESNFGRLRNVSNAGAVGPMQFLPPTWASYGMGGNVRDPHDAVLGAANYLHANGAGGRGGYARAIYHYNPSSLYVNSVLRYSRAMRRDPHAFSIYWNWQS